MVREGGLVHRRAGRARIAWWRDISKVKQRGQNNALSRAFGWDVYCRVRVTGGPNLVITGLAWDAEELADTVEKAVRLGVWPLSPRGA